MLPLSPILVPAEVKKQTHPLKNAQTPKVVHNHAHLPLSTLQYTAYESHFLEPNHHPNKNENRSWRG